MREREKEKGASLGYLGGSTVPQRVNYAEFWDLLIINFRMIVGTTVEPMALYIVMRLIQCEVSFNNKKNKSGIAAIETRKEKRIETVYLCGLTKSIESNKNR